jgi:hypothetical protein
MVFLATTFGAAALIVGCNDIGAAAKKRVPCDKHTTSTTPTKKECLRAYKRSRVEYPKSPTWSEAMARMTPYEERSLLAIGRCEMGEYSRPTKRKSKAHPPVGSRWATLRYGLSLPRYSTAFGIWNGNGAYIRSETGYSFPGATPAEAVLGATALARRYGFSAWACHR